MRWLWGVPALYALGGFLAGASLGAEWLGKMNRAGYANGQMLAAPFCLIIAASALRWMAVHGPRDDVAAFYSRLSWAMVLGAAVWSRVGWLGRWPDGLRFELALTVAAAVAGILALVSMARVGRASTVALVRSLAAAVVASVVALAVFCAYDLAIPLGPGPSPAHWLGWAALVGVPGAAVAVAFLLPLRRSRS